MKNDVRKAAIAACKERKPAAGIYALRSTATGEIWLGATSDMDKIQNRIRFTLGHGTPPHLAARAAWISLHATWEAHGPDDLKLEPVQILDDKEWTYRGPAYLRERLAHWAQKLSAPTL